MSDKIEKSDEEWRALLPAEPHPGQQHPGSPGPD